MAAADELLAARRDRTPRRPFTDTDPDLDEDWGYRVQELDRDRRIAAGERLVGAKLGLTSRAKQVTMGVHRPIAGFLTDAMLISGDDHGLLSRTAQPRIEPEIAFRLGRDLTGPLTFGTAAAAIDTVAVAAEIIDSRFAGFGFRLPDVVADNASAAAFLVGDWRPVPTDLATAKCRFTADGDLVGTAAGAAILGHPLHALVHLADHLTRRGTTLPAGAIILAGALTDAVPIHPDVTYRVEIDGLGSLAFTTSS